MTALITKLAGYLMRKMMLDFLKPYLPIVAIAVLCVTHGVAYIKGRDVGIEKLHVYQLEVEKANATVAEQNAETLRLAEQRTREVAQAYVHYSNDIVREHNSRLAGLQQQASHCATMSRVAASTAGVDAPATDSGPVETAPDSNGLISVCTRLEADCAATTLQLVWLQKWAKGGK